jgi:peptide/nickel transport system substrate-binding protein
MATIGSTFNRPVTKLTLAALLLGGSLAACGSSSKPSSSGSSATTAGSGSSTGTATATAASGVNGTLNWYGQGLPTSWDPVFSSAGHDVGVLSLAYSALTQLSPTGVAQPAVASSWAYSANGLALTFTLKPGLTFTDGTPLNAQAVKVNLDRARTATGSLVASLLTAIGSETVVSTDVIRLNLTRQDQELPLTLGGKAGMLASPTVIADHESSLATQPVGAGPFKLTSFVPDGDATFVRNPGYWNAANIHVAKIYLSAEAYDTTPESVLAALQSGQANVGVINGNQVAAAKAAGFNIQVIPTFAVTDIEVNNTKAPFTNPLVTQAVDYALNRQSLAESQTFGYGKPDDEPEPPGYFAYSPAVANYYNYDPAKAKALLAQAGFPGGKGLTVDIVTSPPTGLAEALQSELQAVGIHVTISTIPATESTTLVYVNHEEAFATSGFAGREAPVDMLQLGFGADGLLNPGRNAPANLTAALLQAATVPLTSPKFTSTIQNVVALGVKENPNIFLYTTPLIWAYAKNISGVTPYLDYQELQGLTIGK